MTKKDIHVVGAVIIKENKILCAQRGASKLLPYKWEFPGGKIERNETPQEALKREVIEELNCEVSVNDQVEHTAYEYDFGIVHLSTYRCQLQKGEPVLIEHEAFKWLEKDELATLDWAAANRPTVKKLQST
ncbi:(deoxy)nucleoside triphosphate pyrophosphohydrolase [Amphibacillus cookii]|uniref:(deoxy)nucleoside triphosphate pyrophosphohydrolase n=1 Tax=Amphibacillus cookii TaxID=767787 RepID=UPI00195D2451|nr:(deoxy)nucleoside triphosphate pyrophosphohydrolase [Amphibacillus cookii]MBM7541184.1 8-oxo-dGTP diphosphatase [Amphibacillus cookii]